jgi:hypothetical protein
MVLRRTPGIVTIAAEITTRRIARPYLRSVRSEWLMSLPEKRRTAEGFERRTGRRWKRPFALLELQIDIAREAGSAMNRLLRAEAPRKDRQFVDEMTRLHARGCQVATEILALLQKGFADGAFARWRSLHEITVVSTFIGKYAREMARRYLDHETIESVRAATGYAEVAARLGHSPMDPADIASLENERAKLLRKYGDSFGAEYGWAAPAFKSSRPRFADIERFVGLDHLRPYYKMASHGVHANPKGVLFQLGNPRIDTLLMAGPTNFGLADPGQTTALSLAQLTAALVQLAPLIEHQLTLAAMNLIAKDAAKAFVGVQLGIEKAEERIQAKARREAAH